VRGTCRHVASQLDESSACRTVASPITIESSAGRPASRYARCSLPSDVLLSRRRHVRRGLLASTRHHCGPPMSFPLSVGAALLRVIAWSSALLLCISGCELRETHARCKQDSDCTPDRECYLDYCVVRAVSDTTGTSTPVTPAANSHDAATATLPATAVCASATEPAEGACCTEPAACYDGPAGTLGVGVCRAGARACTGGRLGPCTDQVTPGSESCENEGADDDCDGVMDDLEQRGGRCALSSGFGECGEGQLGCVDGMASLSCVAVGPPAVESCNDKDEDCDGKIDEDFDISTDAKNCGACGTACAQGELCCGGSCLTQAAASASGCSSCSTQRPCSPAAECCGGACRDMLRDRRHCGACGHSCEQGLRCCAGACKPSCS